MLAYVLLRHLIISKRKNFWSTKAKLSRRQFSYSVQGWHEPYFTGGRVQVSSCGEYLLTQYNTQVCVVELSTGNITQKIGQEDDSNVSTFIITPDDSSLIIARNHLEIEQWNWTEPKQERTWKAIHTAPVSCMGCDSSSTLLATGGSDHSILVWDVHRKYLTNNLKGFHQGVITVVKFHPDFESNYELVSGSSDHKICIWDCKKSTCKAQLTNHFSTITDIAYSQDYNYLYSSARDNAINVYDLETYEKTATIPTFENVEGLHVLPKKTDLYEELGIKRKSELILSAGHKGVMKIWCTSTAQCVYTHSLVYAQSSSEEESTSQGYSDVQYVKSTNTLVLTTVDHNVVVFSLNDLSLQKEYVGFNDSILSMSLCNDNKQLLVASNTNQLKLFTLNNWSCSVISGHTDTILDIDVDPTSKFVATCSKDQSVRLWRVNKSDAVLPVAFGTGHTHSVMSVRFSRTSSSFLVTGSEDKTIKYWPLSDVKWKKKSSQTSHKDLQRIVSTATAYAHNSDINDLAISPNDKLVATASHDKTAKLWSLPDFSLVGSFQGHKRPLWGVQFSPVDQCLATCAGDGYIKIWSLSDFTCVKTFEGHEGSILQVKFLSRGMQLLSSGSDGLLKLWNVKTMECSNTFDEHNDRIWSITTSTDEDMLISAGADSTIIRWKDVTETEKAEEIAKQTDILLKEQKLSNLLASKKYLKAISLAITLNQPFRVLGILKGVLEKPNGEEELVTTIYKLRKDQIGALFGYINQWNKNSKHCHTAHFVLGLFLKKYTYEELMEMPDAKTCVEGLLSYTERHFERMKRLLQQAMFVQYTWQCMKPVSDNKQLEGIPTPPQSVIRIKDEVIPDDERGDSESLDLQLVKTEECGIEITEVKQEPMIVDVKRETDSDDDSANSESEASSDSGVHEDHDNDSDNDSSEEEVPTVKPSKKRTKKETGKIKVNKKQKITKLTSKEIVKKHKKSKVAR